MMDQPRPVAMLRTAGFWLALVMAVLQAVNAVRAFADPAGFADYIGLPLADASDVGFVHVYGLRTAFIAGLVLVFLALRRLDALVWMALVAVLMPVGDAVLASNAGAPTATIARHATIAVYVFVAFVFLRRAAARMARSPI